MYKPQLVCVALLLRTAEQLLGKRKATCKKYYGDQVTDEREREGERKWNERERERKAFTATEMVLMTPPSLLIKKHSLSSQKLCPTQGSITDLEQAWSTNQMPVKLTEHSHTDAQVSFSIKKNIFRSVPFLCCRNTRWHLSKTARHKSVASPESASANFITRQRK